MTADDGSAGGATGRSVEMADDQAAPGGAGRDESAALDRARRRADIEVGAFVLLTLVAAVAIVLTLAQKRHVFERRVVIHTIFQQVDGLREGAPVRLSGVNIGLVSRIAFATERRASLIHVDLEISRESLERVGTDSVARIGTQGLLGDKIVELSVSNQEGQPLVAGGTIESQPPADFNRLLVQASGVLDRATHVADSAVTLMASLASPESLASVRGTLASLDRLTTAAVSGRGLVHTLFYDPAQAQSVRALIAKVDLLSRHIDEAVLHVDAVLGATDKDGRQLVNNLSRAASAVGDTAADIHRSRIVAQVDHASADLADLLAFAHAGHGTVGMAFMDPTVYEQLVVVLGGVARSRVLRALVRYAIRRGDGSVPGRAVDEPADPPLAARPAAARPR